MKNLFLTPALIFLLITANAQNKKNEIILHSKNNSQENSSTSSITKKVLFLGNSYTYVNNLPQLISDMATSVGDNLIFDSNLIGGYTLNQHWNDQTSKNKIMQGGWDKIVLQEQSQQMALQQYNTNPIVDLNNLAKQYNPCSETLLYMTWGRKNGDAQFCPTWPYVCTYSGMDSLIRKRSLYSAEIGLEISPVGAVWRFLRANNPSIDLYQTDDSHPSVEGSYAAACSFYTAIFGKDPSNITFNSTLQPSVALIIRNATKQVVFDSLSYWHIGEYIPNANFIYSVTNTQNQVSFSNSSTNASSYQWNFGDNSSSTNISPAHTYTANGTYTVTLTATRCSSTSIKSVVISFCAHTPTISGVNPAYCPNSLVSLSTQNFDAYQWYDTNNNPIAGETNQTISSTNIVGEAISVKATLNGCSELSPVVYINGYGNSIITFTTIPNGPIFNSNKLCLGDSLELIFKPLIGNYDPSQGIIQWYRNGTIINSSNNDTLYTKSTGNYSVALVHNNCPNLNVYSSVIGNYNFVNCDTTNLKNYSRENNSLKISPNPASSYLNIHSLKDGNYRILNSEGKLIMVIELKTGENRIDISWLNSGLYCLQSTERCYKFIVNKD